MKLNSYLKIIVSVLIYLIISLPIIFAQELNLQYDSVGNLVTGDSFYREYDGFNHLIRIKHGNTSSGNITEEFIWHPIEERIFIKKIYWNNQTLRTTIKYLNENTIKIKNESGTFYENYIYQDDILVAQRDANGNKQAIHNDHLGSTSLITDEQGNVVENTFYSPKGEILSGGEVGKYTFTGKEFSKVTQDYDFLARRYRPDWGIFLQCDKRIQNAFDPQLLNCYSYARNNPYLFIDPDGREVRLAFRSVETTFTFGTHAYLILNPDNQRDFSEDYYSFTLGGFNENGNLVINKDFGADIDPVVYKGDIIVSTPEGKTDTQFINDILDLWMDYKVFDKKHKYERFPESSEGEANSNVAATSLLIGGGVPRSFFNNLNPAGKSPGLGVYSSTIGSLNFKFYYNQANLVGGSIGDTYLSSGVASRVKEILSGNRGSGGYAAGVGYVTSGGRVYPTNNPTWKPGCNLGCKK